ncbi:hypothetical protein [Nonomuraea roseoviolacea]|uniref:DUF3040 domain-containing protein n=1 Tax=Nonomuraea roseoviolacea subsp. carminata TaxID=160689 RepID=A0ABT1K9P1_9ACTN|nr:hypothetical protein [Nonomuraea roseoviolacea]MCP2350665.1 hypothetical protein [Nonomuraea roseoviolacea subsp. carminata]
MHDLTHEQTLRAALHAEVDDLDPCDCLPHILAAARRHAPWLLALLAGIGIALIATGILLATQHGEPTHTPAIRLLEA